jgi:predicted regulator of Ras-like GTPase activity (Roadblock/LC7/MglB family)
MTRADQLASALDDFLAVSPDVEGAAIVSPDGFPMASALPAHVEEERLAAMSAALLILGERSASELGKGNLAQIFVEGPYGHVVIMAAGQAAVMVAVTSTSAKIGLVIFEMRQTTRRIASVMAGAQEVSGVEVGASPLSNSGRYGEPQPATVSQGDPLESGAPQDFIDIRDTQAHHGEP